MQGWVDLVERGRAYTFVEDKEPAGGQLQFASGDEILQTARCTHHYVNLATGKSSRQVMD